MNKNTKRNYKTKDPKSKQRTNRKENYNKDFKGNSPSNDRRWYSKFNSLTLDSGSLPYGLPLGTLFKRDVELPSGASYTLDNVKNAIPGILVAHVAPAVGISSDANSPVNRATRMIYSWVRHINSGHANYDPNDLMIYLLAMDQIYSFITFCCRAYGVFNVYSQMNKYMAKPLISAMGLDYDDFLSHMMDFKYFIDKMTVETSSFCVPDTMDIFKRHAFMYQGIYKDNESPKSGMYLYTPSLFWKYDELSGAGCLKPYIFKGATPDAMKFSELVAYGNNLLSAIALSEDLGIMSGDILKAFGQDKLVKLSTIDFNYVVIPAFNHEVLEQFKNMVPTWNFMDSTDTKFDTWGIYQDAGINGFLKFEPVMKRTGVATSGVLLQYDKLMTTIDDPVAPEVNLLNSRLIAFEDQDDTTKTFSIVTCGSEIITDLRMYMHTDTGLDWVHVTTNTLMMSTTQTSAVNVDRMRRVAGLRTFAYAPELLWTFMDNTNSKTYVIDVFDVDNYARVRRDEIEALHETALLSMFNVPLLGLWNSEQ